MRGYGFGFFGGGGGGGGGGDDDMPGGKSILSVVAIVEPCIVVLH
jgi:hypothetical protein